MAFRAFISVDLPRLELLVALTEELRGTGASLKLVDPDQVHLTLKFLGDTEEALVPRIVEAMRASAAGVAPFTVRIAGTGAFPNLRRMNVLWVGMSGAEPLVQIARGLGAGVEPLGYPREGRDFSPHVTIARVKGGRGQDEARRVLDAHVRDDFGGFAVDRIRLKKSVLTPQGPVYSTVEDVAL
ncbi:MAG: RNA 2',3'-cyclic phosphodiesterase [Methanobacteriota archaeon]|nr:MAG: RNA 2',3'-cyclic phosphodiesterase [Euryarchaeota archaeon]